MRSKTLRSDGHLNASHTASTFSTEGALTRSTGMSSLLFDDDPTRGVPYPTPHDILTFVGELPSAPRRPDDDEEEQSDVELNSRAIVAAERLPERIVLEDNDPLWRVLLQLSLPTPPLLPPTSGNEAWRQTVRSNDRDAGRRRVWVSLFMHHMG
ncbi:hypothetical protein DQ04_11451030 [Trypanosoma grayi]|uniref:hypothetical protein n=1 Tax=Trypanosoma grayi TaxID=71804 RepID=UPI0004F49595|nr:hypothetical protein DQ04_11451030 [Trypanosoma grayi]KEG06968.1 hypothetical protein DQ04_11451030 [Trypanosoma grayi]